MRPFPLAIFSFILLLLGLVSCTQTGSLFSRDEFLYVANADSNDISSYVIDRSMGALRAVATRPLPRP